MAAFFGDKNTEKGPPPEAAAASANKEPESGVIKDENIHVIPARFYNIGGPIKKKMAPQQKMLIFSLIIFSVTVLMIIYTLIIVTRSPQEGRIINNDNVVIPETRTRTRDTNTNTNTNSNANANTNVNANVNANTNVNTNANANANTNANTNSNINGNTNANANENANANQNTNSAVPRFIPSSLDTDGDALTDVEEALYDTDKLSDDTDRDGYTDGHELKHLYNPIGIEPDSLLGSFLVQKFINDQYRYVVLYPTKWFANPADLTNREVSFLTGTEEKIVITVKDNPQSLDVRQWVAQELNVAPSQLGTELTKKNVQGIKSPDGLSYYIASPDRRYIYELHYDIGNLQQANFKQTFLMMFRSFDFQ